MTVPPRRETLADWKRLCKIAIDQRNTYAAERNAALQARNDECRLRRAAEKFAGEMQAHVLRLEAELTLQREIVARYHQNNCLQSAKGVRQ